MKAERPETGLVEKLRAESSAMWSNAIAGGYSGSHESLTVLAALLHEAAEALASRAAAPPLIEAIYDECMKVETGQAWARECIRRIAGLVEASRASAEGAQTHE